MIPGSVAIPTTASTPPIACSLHRDVAVALAAYAAARTKRANAIVRRSRQMARVAHLCNPLAAGARNALLWATSPKAALRQLEPVLGG